MSFAHLYRDSEGREMWVVASCWEMADKVLAAAQVTATYVRRILIGQEPPKWESQ